MYVRGRYEYVCVHAIGFYVCVYACGWRGEANMLVRECVCVIHAYVFALEVRNFRKIKVCKLGID